MSKLHFWLMAKKFKNRYKPENVNPILDETGIKEGDNILDFGCGPGGYSIFAAKRVGESGKVYAMDLHAMAGKRVKRWEKKEGLKNIEFIHSDCTTGLDDKSIDVILMYDVFHEIGNKEKTVLSEMSRVLKDDGVLSFSDHHLEDEEIRKEIDELGLFEFLKKGEKTYSFKKKFKSGIDSPHSVAYS